MLLLFVSCSSFRRGRGVEAAQSGRGSLLLSDSEAKLALFILDLSAWYLTWYPSALLTAGCGGKRKGSAD